MAIPINVQHIRKFIQFAGQELKLPTLPQIKLVGSQENQYDAFGHSQGNLIVVRVTERHPIDIMRTLAHELLHYKQNILGIRSPENTKEDQANVVAGRIMRKFDVKFPEVFKDKSVKANMLHESALGATPVNAMGASASSGEGGNIGLYDPLLNFKKGRRDGLSAKNLMKQPKSLNAVLKKDLDRDH